MYNFYFFKYTLEEFLLRPMMFKREPGKEDDRKKFRNRQPQQLQQKTELRNSL